MQIGKKEVQTLWFGEKKNTRNLKVTEKPCAERGLITSEISTIKEWSPVFP